MKTHSFEHVNLHRFERVASFLRLDPKPVLREVISTIGQALEVWPALAPELLGEERGNRILSRLQTLSLVREVS